MHEKDIEISNKKNIILSYTMSMIEDTKVWRH